VLFDFSDEDELIFLNEDDESDSVIQHRDDYWKILIVDDEEEVHHVTKMVLADIDFEGKKILFLHAYSGMEAKKILQTEEDIAVILLDVVMEEENAGLLLAQFIREELKNKMIRIILRTGQPGQAPEKQVIVEYDINDYKEKTELTSQKLFSTIIVAIRSFRDLKMIGCLNEEIENTQREIIYTLGEIAETRSKETGYHVKRVAEYSCLLAEKYGLSEKEIELIRIASPMHDVGKVAISDDILNKPGKLTLEEYQIMKTHTNIGYEMLKHSNRTIIQTASIIARQHHEKYNGGGYPSGIKGEDIHLYSRITAIADVFDALSSNRVYKSAWTTQRIVEFFKSERGEHFDPKLTDLFLENFNEFLEIKEKYRDTKVI
jgi:response regulator RpfG family c-di-GMP phosphodiesterase